MLSVKSTVTAGNVFDNDRNRGTVIGRDARHGLHRVRLYTGHEAALSPELGCSAPSLRSWHPARAMPLASAAFSLS